ncbi:uncharacterized protein LOC128218079 isoform X2 [Mya arenaria]|uniref:uncharacterized protein LOC128218079 isoform X2 n=1 Tax=Mya arenaria TaxID=6604 RepID=UPI0022E62BEB|nr:uncharacterized protein LOC128218079 isoform X2 [Mya arenaria]
MVSFIILALVVTLASARPQTGSTTVDIIVTTPAGQPPCKDILTQCNLLDKDFYCKGEYFNWAFENCKNYCGLCNYTTSCVYKGQSYQQDQTWLDGCSQSCTCTDASKGVYTCGNVCLNWENLPSICHLEPPSPGLCCEQPRCPDNVIINIPPTYKDQYPVCIYYIL